MSYFCGLIFTLFLRNENLLWWFKKRLKRHLPCIKNCLEAVLTNPLVFRTSGFQQRILVYLSDYIAVSIFLLPSSRYNFSVGALTPCKFPLSFRGYPAGLTQFMLYILA